MKSMLFILLYVVISVFLFNVSVDIVIYVGSVFIGMLDILKY